MTPSIAELLQAARKRIQASSLDAPPREAQLLLSEVLGLSEAQLLARDDHTPSPERAETFEALLTERLAGRPMAYLLGEREFYGRRFQVDERVLIPRPETEHLVEAALAIGLPESKIGAGARSEPVEVIDVGTGSGAIAITLKLERPQWTVYGCDRSLGALAVAKRNAVALGADVTWWAGDLLGAVAGLPPQAEGHRLVVSNPPYIAERDRETLSHEILEHEPLPALFAGEDGLDLYRRLLTVSDTSVLGAALLLEIGQGQEDAVAALCQRAGFDTCERIPDYAGIVRVVVAHN